MANSTTIISLPQMVDLALNSPEVGIVNFTVLHSLLHVIVHQLELNDTNVEFRGSDSERLQNYIATAKPGPMVTLTEYTVGSDGTASKKTGDDPAKEPGTSQSKQTIVVVEPKNKEHLEAPKYAVTVTKEQLTQLENDIASLKKKVEELTDLPGNIGLIEAIRSNSGPCTPVLDMFQIMSLTKRMEAAESAVSKIGSMMEDLAKGSQGWSPNSGFEGGAGYGRAGDGAFDDSEGSGGGGGGAHLSGEAYAVLENLKKDVENLKELLSSNDVATQCLKEVEEMKKTFTSNPDAMPPDVRLNKIELKFDECMEQVNALDDMYNQEFGKQKQKLDILEKDLSTMWNKIQSGSLPDGGKGDGGNEFGGKLLELQKNINEISETAHMLITDMEGKDSKIEMMLEEIELLKTVKANREDLDDALADKADACQVYRKVSQDQFDTVYNEISRTMDTTVERLEKQEEYLNQALSEVQTDIGNKLDRLELGPLRDFINAKLKRVQDKLKKIVDDKRDAEAAGTKSKFLTDVNCISCDNKVIMRKQMDPTLLPRPYAMPAHKNMGPLLAYQLDQLRKEKKELAQGKNVNLVEDAARAGKNRHLMKDHICNRYCGGSHTVTTPRERVGRIGHFLEQWGPEIVPVNDVLIKGTDGHLYKSRDDDLLKQLATEKPPSPKVGLEKSPIQIQGSESSRDKIRKSSDEVRSSKGDISAARSKSATETTGSKQNLTRHSKSSVTKGSVKSITQELPEKEEAPPKEAEPTGSLKQEKSGSIKTPSRTEATEAATKEASVTSVKSNGSKASPKQAGSKASVKEDGGKKTPSREMSKQSVKQESKQSLKATEPPIDVPETVPEAEVEVEPPAE